MFNGGDALEHKSRKLIYNYISSHPGASFGTIRDFFDMNESTLKYHLIYLERTKRISSSRKGRRRCYFCNGGVHKFDQQSISFPRSVADPLTKNQQHILNVIQRNPGIQKKDLVRKTKLHRKTVSYNIERLIEHKLVWKVKTAGEVGYEHITKEKLRSEMYNKLLMKLLSDEIDEKTFKKIKEKLEKLDIDKIKI